MAVFSTNQARQIIVGNYIFTSALTEQTKAGYVTIGGKYTDGTLITPESLAEKPAEYVYFNYIGAGGKMRSDLIKKDKTLWVNYTPATTLARPKKAYTIELDSTINAGNPITGQDYIVRLDFNQYVGISDEHTYQKYGMVHAYSGMTKSAFYKNLVVSLFKNFSRELAPLVDIVIADKVVANVTWDSITSTYNLLEADGTAITVDDDYDAGVTLIEAEQEWTLGIKEQTPVYFTVTPTTVVLNGDEVIWGKVTPAAALPGGYPATIGNGKAIADLEYFCVGERGDQYRNIGWPNSIPTKYLVDPTLEYDVLDIHYYDDLDNQSVQKSEKTLTIVASTRTNYTIGDLANQLRAIGFPVAE